MKTFDVQAEFQGTYTAKRRSTALMVHHAAALYPTHNGIQDVRQVANYHTHTRRWPGIGYHICLAEETQGGSIARYNCSDQSLIAGDPRQAEKAGDGDSNTGWSKSIVGMQLFVKPKTSSKTLSRLFYHSHDELFRNWDCLQTAAVG